MTLSDRDRRALTLGAVVVGLLGLYALMEWRWDLAESHGTVSDRVARLVQDHRKGEYQSRQVSEYEAKWCELSKPLPYSESITQLGEKIFTAARESGVQLKSSTPSTASPYPDDASLELTLFTIDVETNWESAFKFVNALYRTPGVLSIEQSQLSGDPKKGGNLTMKLTVSVIVQAANKSGNLWAS